MRIYSFGKAFGLLEINAPIFAENPYNGKNFISPSAAR